MLAQDLATEIERIAGGILDYAVVLAAVATVVVALLELVKAAFRLRLRYHRHRVKRWIHHETAREELLVLAVSGVANAHALFDQPTDKMMGQIQAAATVALDFPDRYTRIYEFLTASPEAEQVGAAEQDDVASARRDQETWREFMEDLERGGDVSGAMGTGATDGEVDARTAAASRARARLEHFVARKLDAFQTSLEYDWARLNQLVAVPAGAIFLVVLLADHYGKQPGWVIFGSIFGGMLAPFAKDVVSALSDLRVRRS